MTTSLILWLHKVNIFNLVLCAWDVREVWKEYEVIITFTCICIWEWHVKMVVTRRKLLLQVYFFMSLVVFYYIFRIILFDVLKIFL